MALDQQWSRYFFYFIYNNGQDTNIKLSMLIILSLKNVKLYRTIIQQLSMITSS